MITDSSEKKFLHDISTPLSVLLFHLEAASETDDPIIIREKLKLIREQTEKIVTLIRNQQNLSAHTRGTGQVRNRAQ